MTRAGQGAAPTPWGGLPPEGNKKEKERGGGGGAGGGWRSPTPSVAQKPLTPWEPQIFSGSSGVSSSDIQQLLFPGDDAQLSWKPKPATEGLY